MPYFDIIWDFEGEDGNDAHIAEHGLTTDDVEHVLTNPDVEAVSRSSGRPIAFGYAPDGRYVCVVYEQFDDITIYPVTAFEVEEEDHG